ncbi:CDP-alcohol phosphatidyltransferase family protein [Patescibacteria group bacterium]|nr:CDP-alcohol phosphatidyltransferase family protein [Patescibacteria group bacterium]
MQQDTKEKILNIANGITLLRFFLILVFLLFAYRASYLGAFLIFVLIFLLDGLDGFFARKNGEVTQLGIAFDISVDSLAMWTGFVFYLAREGLNELVIILFISGLIINLVHSLLVIFAKIGKPQTYWGKAVGCTSFVLIMTLYAKLAFLGNGFFNNLILALAIFYFATTLINLVLMIRYVLVEENHANEKVS